MGPEHSDERTDADPSSSTTVEIIRNRRSTRTGFENRGVPTDIIRAIVSCGLAAPSSKNAQPWAFHVVQSKTQLREFADLVRQAEGLEDFVPHDALTGKRGDNWESTVLESAEVLGGVSSAIFVENRVAFGGGRKALSSTTTEHIQAAILGYGLEMLGLGAAVQNMLIAAASLKIQAAFMGDILIAEEQIGERLGITGELIGVLILGFSSEQPPPRARMESGLSAVTWHT
jgi:nitroreductase